MRPWGTRSAAKAAAVLVALALLAWILAMLPALGPVRVVAGLLLVFVLPGLAATAALFPEAGPSRLEWIVLVPALSLAVPVIGGVLVDVVGLRLTAGSWGGLGAFATLVLACVGYVRQRGHSGAQSEWPPPPEPWKPPPPGASRRAVRAANRPLSRPSARAWAGRKPAALVAALVPAGLWPPPVLGRTARRLAPLAAAVALLGGAGWIGLHSATTRSQEAFTVLSMQPDDDRNADDQVRPVTISVDCHEAQPTRYTVRLQEGVRAGPRYQLSLNPGQVWKQSLNVPITGQTTANLFKGDGTTPYRTVFVSGLQ